MRGHFGCLAPIRCPDEARFARQGRGADGSRATALTRADFFANQAIDRVLNPLKSTKIHSHYAVVSPKHERYSIARVRLSAVIDSGKASGVIAQRPYLKDRAREIDKPWMAACRSNVEASQ